MKKTLPSSSVGNGSPGPFIEAGRVGSEAGLPLIQPEVQQDVHREDIRGHSQHPAERSNQLRNRRR